MNRYKQQKSFNDIKCQEKSHENNSIQFICLQEQCKSKRFYCSKCAMKHQIEHGQYLVSIEDIFSNKDPSQIENYPINPEEKKINRCLTQQQLISSQSSTISEIIDNMINELKQDILFQIDDVHRELKQYFKSERMKTEQSMSDFQFTQSTTFSINDLRYFVEQYINDNDDYKFNTNLLSWLAQSIKNKDNIRKSTNKGNLNQEMIPSIISSHQVKINQFYLFLCYNEIFWSLLWENKYQLQLLQPQIQQNQYQILYKINCYYKLLGIYKLRNQENEVININQKIFFKINQYKNYLHSIYLTNIISLSFKQKNQIQNKQKKYRSNLISYISRDLVLPAHLEWGLKKSRFENSNKIIEILNGVSFEGCGVGDQTLISTNSFDFGRHEFEIQFDKLSFSPQCHFIIGLISDSNDDSKIFDSNHPYSCLFCDRVSNQMRKINSVERKFVMDNNSNNNLSPGSKNNIIKVVLDFEKDTFYFTDEKNTMTSLWTSLKNNNGGQQRWKFQITFKTEFTFSNPSPQHAITLLSSS